MGGLEYTSFQIADYRTSVTNQAIRRQIRKNFSTGAKNGAP